MNEPLHLILANASLAHQKKCRQQFQAMNLSDGQPKVLSILSDHEGVVQKELASICHVEPATMTILLKKMQSDGLIEKTPVSVSGGKRAFRIYLTDKGHQMSAAVNQIMEDAQVLAFSGFSDKERADFLQLIERLTKNLE